MFWWAASAGNAAAATTVNCQSAPQTLESRHKRLNELHALWAEMTDLFGNVDEPEGKKKSAKKVKISSTRKRLQSKIETHEKELDELTTKYCNACSPGKEIPDANRFCDFCGELDQCQPKE